MQKRRPCGSRNGADLCGGDQHLPTKYHARRPPLDDLADYQALRLVDRFGVPPALAFSLAEMAFGGGK